MISEICGAHDGVFGHSIIEGQPVHIRIGKDFQDIEIREMDPFDLLENIQSQERLFLCFSGNPLQHLHLQNDMGVGFGYITDILHELIDIQILAYQRLDPGGPGFQRHIDVHSPGRRHQVDKFPVQNVCSQAVGEEELDVEFLFDDGFENSTAVLFIQIEDVVDKHELADSGLAAIADLLHHMLRAAGHMGFGPDFVAIEAIVGTTAGHLQGDCFFHRRDADAAMVFAVIHQCAIGPG